MALAMSIHLNDRIECVGQCDGLPLIGFAIVCKAKDVKYRPKTYICGWTIQIYVATPMTYKNVALCIQTHLSLINRIE